MRALQDYQIRVYLWTIIVVLQVYGRLWIIPVWRLHCLGGFLASGNGRVGGSVSKERNDVSQRVVETTSDSIISLGSKRIQTTATDRKGLFIK